MKYIYATSTEPVVIHLVDAITSQLSQGKTVLWLLSGGSGGKVCMAVSKRLSGDLTNLITTLSDERYVPVGDPDENWQQLVDGGFSVSGATTYRPLQGKDRDTTTAEYGEWLEQQFARADYKVGLFGMGADGHTAGIKPGTSAVSASGWATSFTGDDFERITMTFDAVKQLDEIVVQAMGADKTEAVGTLLHQDIPMTVQPAQVLKSVAASTLYTDYKENNV